MLKLRENNRLFGAGHLILNALRAFSIIGLLSVAAASWAIVVMSGLTGHFFFFEAMSHFFISCIAVFLIISELNLFKRYFATRWPVLSPYYGLTWLGVAMIVMGCSVLGNLNREAVTEKNMGSHLLRLVLASGILSVTFGVFNIVASIIFRDGKNGITARNIRSDGAIASSCANSSTQGGSFADAYSTRSDSVKKPTQTEEKRFRRLTQKLVPWANGKPKISHPMPTNDLESGTNLSDNENPYPDDRASPLMPDVARPPTALHPINQNDNFRFTKYSEASHLNRF